MAGNLQLYICENFKAETDAILSLGKFSDVVVSYFPPRCIHPISAAKQLESLSLFDNADNDKLFISCSCLTISDKVFLQNKNIKKLHLSNCFQKFAPHGFIDQLIEDGAYIVTPGWLKKWQVNLNSWGDKKLARQMLSESVTKIVLLDTGVDKNCVNSLKDFSVYINLPFEIIPIGLDYYQLYIENEIFKWRLNKRDDRENNYDSKRKIVQSDYAMALDLMGDLTRAETEDEVAKRIIDLFVMMFAANKVHYLAVINSNDVRLWSFPAETGDDETKDRLLKFTNSSLLTESGRGFCMTISRGDKILAVIEIDDISYHENLVKYQNLALAMSDVISIAIVNSRYFEKIYEMNKSLKELNATKDKFFSIIAHDLKGSFNSMLGFSTILNENFDRYNVEKQKQFIEIIYTNIQNTYKLLENLLLWSRSQKGSLDFKPEKTNLFLVTNDTSELLNQSAENKSIELINKINENIFVDADKEMLSTILRNLISNAIKFTPRYGKILINSNLIKSDNNQHFVIISVTDTGKGISKEIQDKLFDIGTNISIPGTENEKGTGLGLILCKEFVEKHGGRIWVESELNNGTVFNFTLLVSR
ncbi:ATP-binding protein [Marinilabiliaceae bacterium ANBcel2]|nr:ATP-binding protein [Marinilabiliaceae bacterium ANBcel2]